VLDPILVELAKTQRLLRTALADAAGKDAVGPSHLVVLEALSSRPRMTGADLARAAAITPQAMNEVLRRLEHTGEIRRRPHPSDKRKIEYEIAPAGHTRIEEWRAAQDHAEERLSGSWSHERQDELLATLRAANADLERLLKEPPIEIAPV
jgi:DNA-binding MarR family transcriptional regulator